MRKWLLIVLIAVHQAAPLAAVLPPPSDDVAREDITLVEGRSASTPEHPSRTYAVQGADLKARLGLALEHSRGCKTDFWTGYMLDTTADLDPETPAAELGAEAGTSMDPGKALILIRYAPGVRDPVRVVVSAVDGPRGEPGLPTYWLGRARQEESLGLVLGLLKAPSNERVAVTLTRALGLHAGPRAVAALRDLARRSTLDAVRANAVRSLGRSPRQGEFVASLMIDERETLEVRKAAAAALGDNREPETLAMIRALYPKISDPDVKRRVLQSALKLGKESEVLAWASHSSRVLALPSPKRASPSPSAGVLVSRR